MVVDTNIFIYASQADSPFHHDSIRALQFFRDRGKRFAVTAQILQEYLAVGTREHRLNGKPPLEFIFSNYRLIISGCKILFDNEASLLQLQNLAESKKIAGREIYDANIVATMIAGGEEEILTNNPNDFSAFSSLIHVISLESVQRQR